MENFGALRCDLASLKNFGEFSGENQYGILAYWYIGVLEIGTDRVSPHWYRASGAVDLESLALAE